MLALALVMEGQNRTEAACAAGMDRQTPRDWVHRYNAQGLQGLTNQPNRGAPKRQADRGAGGRGRRLDPRRADVAGA
jgi:transposase